MLPLAVYLPKIFLQSLSYYFFKKTEGFDASKQKLLFSQIFMKTSVSRENWKTIFTNSFDLSRFSLGPYSSCSDFFIDLHISFALSSLFCISKPLQHVTKRSPQQ